MNKLAVIAAIMGLLAAGGLSLGCEEEPDNGDSDTLGSFSIEVTGDTVGTVPELGEVGEFGFKLKNHTDQAESLTMDVPEGLADLPEGWQWQLCVEATCLAPMTPATVLVPAQGSYDSLDLNIMSQQGGTEGKVTIEVSGIADEIERQTFILKIAQ